MTTNKHNPELENMEKILKREKRIRIFRIIFSVIFVIGSVSFWLPSFRKALAIRPVFLAAFFLPLLFFFEYKALKQQKYCIKKNEETLSQNKMSNELFSLHNKLKGRIKRNNILKNLMIIFFLLGFFIFGFSFLGVNNSTEPGMERLFYMMIAFFVFAFGAIFFLIYTILNWTTLELWEDYFEQINKEMTD